MRGDRTNGFRFNEVRMPASPIDAHTEELNYS